MGNDILNGHTGGLIFNNFVHTNRDVGIGLEYAPHADVYHNTVITEDYPNAIEYRFAGTTQVQLKNNLTLGMIISRDGGTATLASNQSVPDLSIFVDHNTYDYHLSAVTSGVTDAAIPLSEVTTDIDCISRPIGDGPDIGADEYEDALTSDVNLANTAIEIFPNPTPGTFKIEGLLGQYDIDVLDSAGMIHQNLDQQSGTIEIDLSSLPDGLFFIRIKKTDNAVQSIQLILKM